MPMATQLGLLAKRQLITCALVGSSATSGVKPNSAGKPVPQLHPRCNGERFMLYHVTPAENLPSILERGLVPRIGGRSAMFGETSKGVYLFNSAEACESGLMNWLGDEFENAELVVLEFDKSGFSGDAHAGYELVCLHTISPDRIVRVLDEELTPITKGKQNIS